MYFAHKPTVFCVVTLYFFWHITQHSVEREQGKEHTVSHRDVFQLEMVTLTLTKLTLAELTLTELTLTKLALTRVTQLTLTVLNSVNANGISTNGVNADKVNTSRVSALISTKAFKSSLSASTCCHKASETPGKMKQCHNEWVDLLRKGKERLL